MHKIMNARDVPLVITNFGVGDKIVSAGRFQVTTQVRGIRCPMRALIDRTFFAGHVSAGAEVPAWEIDIGALGWKCPVGLLVHPPVSCPAFVVHEGPYDKDMQDNFAAYVYLEDLTEVRVFAALPNSVVHNAEDQIEQVFLRAAENGGVTYWFFFVFDDDGMACIKIVPDEEKTDVRI